LPNNGNHAIFIMRRIARYEWSVPYVQASDSLPGPTAGRGWVIGPPVFVLCDVRSGSRKENLMDEHQHDAQPPSGRRKFLSQLGMTAVATAALSGLADVAGLRPAAAATRAARGMKVRDARNRASVVPAATVETAFFGCSLCSGCCDGPCTPSGVYCHYCAGGTLMSNGDVVDSFAGYYCIGGDNNFTLS
jgi:hypothetical protein